MPMYEYRCSECGAVSEILAGVARVDPEVKCDDCGGSDLKKLISLSNFSVAPSTRSSQPMEACAAAPGESCPRCEHAV